MPFPASPTESMGTVLLIGFSSALQYIIPLAFTAGAFFSRVKAKQRATIFDTQSSLQTIRNLSWQEFELLIGEAYRRQGYKVLERGGSAPDGGVDLVLTKEGHKAIVQCKHWAAYTVRVSMIREAFGVMISEAADECIFVTSGRFTKDARRFAMGKPIQLIDRDQLAALLKDINPSFLSSNLPQTSSDLEVPLCPDCGSAMVKRMARRGRRAGHSFWGCTRYPECFGTR